MTKIKPIYLIALVAVIIFATATFLMNPNKKYSTMRYWEKATVENAQDVPDEALKAGNKNGGVLMWAASVTPHPEVLEALVARGADINESDKFFNGTPLSSATIYNENPEIIDTLVQLGADINKTVSFKASALHVAVLEGTHPGIVTKLIENGIDVDAKNSIGKTALQIAQVDENQMVINEIQSAASVSN